MHLCTKTLSALQKKKSFDCQAFSKNNPHIDNMANRNNNRDQQNGSATGLDDSIDTQAVEWVIAQEAEDWPQRQAMFEQWLQVSQAHRQAYARASQSWNLAAQLRHMPQLLAPLPAVQPVHGGDMASTAGKDHASKGHWFSWNRTGRTGAWLGAMLLVWVMGAVWIGGDPSITMLADHRTGMAETRRILLDDGSLVELGADSAIVVNYDGSERRIELLRGQAFFSATSTGTAQAGERPFIVEAGQGQTRALGTQFVVERLPEKTWVTGIEHQVEVSLKAAGDLAGAQAVVLSPGESIRYDHRGLETVQTRDASQALAWQRGLLVFNNEPLSDVIARLERYQRGRIVLARSALAGRPISAVVPLNNTEEALQSIAAELGLEVLQLPMVTLLH